MEEAARKGPGSLVNCATEPKSWGRYSSTQRPRSALLVGERQLASGTQSQQSQVSFGDLVLAAAAGESSQSDRGAGHSMSPVALPDQRERTELNCAVEA